MKGYLAALCIVASSGAFAADGEIQTKAQSSKPWGTYVAIGNPYPTLLGINAAYNIDNNMRASVGYGEVEVTTSLSFNGSGFTQEKLKAQTYAAGMDYLFLDTAIRPLVGLHAGYFSVSGKGTFEIQGLSKSTGLLYSNIGLDWLTSGGFNLGTGFNVAIAGGRGINFYGNIGYFF